MPTSLQKMLLRLSAAVLLASTVLLVAMAGCSQRPPSPPAALTTAAVVSRFVGNDACAECHPKQAEDHKNSGHARSLRLATPEGLGKDAPDVGPIPNTNFAVQEEGGKLYFISTKGKKIRQRMDYAFGAGDTGITFCTINGPTDFTKLRISYFPREKKWRSTPGMEVMSDFDAGTPVTGGAILGCVKCHSVTLPPKTAIAEVKFMSIGCEACHGPGSAHVEAANRKDARDLHMVDLKARSALEVQQICSNCHSPINNSMLVDGNAAMLRFQPESLLASRCFMESDGKISCLTCHDSHKDVDRNPKNYEPACLSCHAPAGVTVPKRIVHARPCPRNPKSGCIPCHMPRKESFHESEVPTMMTDHLIAVQEP